VNYHFGGKDNLAVEVFRRVARHSAETRHAGLDKVAGGDEGPPSLEALIDVFVGAYLDPENRRDGALLANLVLKHRAAPNGWTHAVVRDELDGLALRFIEALCAACPDLPREEVHWRYHMMVGAIVLTLSDRGQRNRIQRLSGGTCSTGDLDALRGALVRFLTAAFRDGGAP
jgi:AcrR family transcriptional regulator